MTEQLTLNVQEFRLLSLMGMGVGGERVVIPKKE